MKFLLISNLCFGSRYERLDLVYRAFDYCKKNGINIILCGGNIIDGFSTSKKQGIPDIRKQVEYAVKNYPSDKNILTFSVLGDRDQNALSNEGIYLEEFFLNHRPDVIFGGFNNTYIYIKNDIILLYHYLSGGRMLSPKGSIVLHGHASKYMTTFINDILNITIPSLSDMNQSVPSALELNLKFNNGFIETANVKQVCFMEKDTVLNEVGFDFPKNKTKKMDRILNIEDYRKDIPTGKIK